jgi:hypothetical protein
LHVLLVPPMLAAHETPELAPPPLLLLEHANAVRAAATTPTIRLVLPMSY